MSRDVHVQFPDKTLLSVVIDDFDKATANTLLAELENCPEFLELFGPSSSLCVLTYKKERRHIPVENKTPLNSLGDAGLSESNPLFVFIEPEAIGEYWFDIPIPLQEDHDITPQNPSSSMRGKKYGEESDLQAAANKALQSDRGDDIPSRLNAEQSSVEKTKREKGNPKPPQQPKHAHEWPNFERAARQYATQFNDVVFDCPAFFNYPKFDEVTGVQPFIYINALSRCTQFDKSLTFETDRPDGERQFFTDFFLVKGTERVACIEVKGDWSLDSDDFIRDYNSGTSGQMISSLKDAVWQLFCQMKQTDLFYGILTSGVHWCFFTRTVHGKEDFLFGSPVFYRSLCGQESPVSVMKALMFFCNQASKTKPTFPPPTAPPPRYQNKRKEDDDSEYGGSSKGRRAYKAPKTRSIPPSSMQLRNQSGKADLKNQEDQLMESPPRTATSSSCDDGIIECEIIKTLPKANADIYLARYKNEDIILKVVDPKDKDQEEWLQELEREHKMYLGLSDLQGEIIPEFKCYGILPDGRYALGLSHCGEVPKWDRKSAEQALKVLEEFHHAGCVHGDIKLDQFTLRDDDKMFLIDLGRSYLAKTEEDIEKMHEEDEELEMRLHRFRHIVKRRKI